MSQEASKTPAEKWEEVLDSPHPRTCEQCPNRFKKRGCPSWITEKDGILETNLQTGEERLLTGCFYRHNIRLLKHVVEVANRMGAAADGVKDEMNKGFRAVVHKQFLDRAEQILQIEHGKQSSDRS